MQFRFATLFPVVALVASVLADDGQCDTGSIQCCTSTYSKSDPTVKQLFGLLNLEEPSIPGQVGLGCSPISVLGGGSGASCTQQPVCCTGNDYNGLINIGCSPISYSA